MRLQLYITDRNRTVGVFVDDTLISKHCDFYHA
jgi:hypothetical protein